MIVGTFSSLLRCGGRCLQLFSRAFITLRHVAGSSVANTGQVSLSLVAGGGCLQLFSHVLMMLLPFVKLLGDPWLLLYTSPLRFCRARLPLFMPCVTSR